MSTDWESDEADPLQTDEDSDYVPDIEVEEVEVVVPDDEHENEYIYVTPTKTRQRKRRPKEWKANSAKRLRTEGKEYIGRKNRVQKAKELKEYPHVCRYQCNDNISEAQRQELFRNFYELPSYDLQTAFLSSCIKKIPPKRHTVAAVANKSYSTVITLVGNRVCKQFFLRTFNISVRRFQTVCKKTTDLNMTEPDKRGKKEPPNKIKESSKNFVISHINMFPKYSSHYSRKDNLNAKYISGELSISKMYKLYEEFCIEKQELPVKESYYRFIFNTEFNLRFHKPYNDTCSRCDNLQNLVKHSTNEDEITNTKRDLELHQRKAKKATDAKKADIAENKNSKNTAVICFDLQQALPTPLLTTSKVFYLRQLWTYNFCVFDLLAGKSHMFIWNETVASRGSQEIGSCLIKFIRSLPSTVTKIVAYSDSCGGQNKNISKLFSFIVQATNITEIHHKFLEPGHTYMECDRSFGLIEKKKRQIPQVFIPADWETVIRGTSAKFVVYEMNKDDFFSFSPFNEIMKDPKKDSDGHPLK
ncbi:unnamed protein product [Psylliodes chrysocephalus]|uniref:DUF7869 domain-containing protein n=1 Tax=Psylliodes chrysocephalus TaxID=3402493 RepID=A0A9P0GIJ2_9CUCU|nr:unnamed protein product [Psylliodes chrysocephala]